MNSRKITGEKVKGKTKAKLMASLQETQLYILSLYTSLQTKKKKKSLSSIFERNDFTILI